MKFIPMYAIQQNGQAVSTNSNVLAIRTNGKSVEVVAQGQVAEFLAGILAVCMIALTVKVISR